MVYLNFERASQVNYAKDKGRAAGVVIGIVLTILGAGVAVFFGKRDHKKGKKYTDDIINQHAEYSSAHQAMVKMQAK